jgi:UDP-glucose 4-epimerase
MDVLVTGGAGFIGCHLVARLVEDGHRVIVLDDLSFGRLENLASLDVELIRADVRDVGAHVERLRSVRCVFHLAALVSSFDSLKQPEPYLATNLLGTLAVIRLCQSLERPRLVFASSSTVYGDTREPLRRESDLPEPSTVYAVTKLGAEQLVMLHREQIGYDDVCLRLFNVYGPKQNAEHPYANVTCKFSKAAARGTPVTLYGDGRQTRDFIYVDDVVDAMLAVARAPTPRRVYNVGTGSDASLGTLLELVQEIAEIDLSVQREPPWPNDIRAIRADVTALRADVGWAPRVELREGLRRTIEWFRAQPK